MFRRIASVALIAALFITAFSACSHYGLPQPGQDVKLATKSNDNTQSPSGETAIGLINASSYYLIFYIDGENMGGVPSGDRSAYFNVSPGRHTVRADARISGKTVSVEHTAYVPSGEIVSWTVTDR